MGAEGGGGFGQFGGCCSWDRACAGCSLFEADVVMNVGQFQGHGRDNSL
jgi:hypothetical protein